MNKKMSLSDFKNYIISEAKKLYKIEILKEQKNKIEKQISILNECAPPSEVGGDYLAGAPLMSPETLAKVRAEMLKKASGWATPESIKVISEIDKAAMQAAKKDIKDDGHKFEPLGKNQFEKNIDKKELKKAMSPEKNLEEKKYSDAAGNFIGKEIGHLMHDKDYVHDRAVAAAINIAKDKGYKIPKKTNEESEVTSPILSMYFFKVKHDTGVTKMKTPATSEENAKKAIMNAEGCPENAITFIKSKPMEISENKPSSGLSSKQKTDVVKKAKAGEDIGHKGKGFKSVADKAAKEYGSKEAGEKVAAAAMWKNIKR